MAIELRRRAEFNMVDLAGWVYYPKYFDLAHRFFEEVWDEVCGMSYDQVLHELGLGFPAASFEATFVAPLRYQSEVVASISIERIGERSITWRFLYHDGAGTKVWEGRKVTVCIDLDTKASTPIPDALRSGLSTLLEG